MHLFLLQKSTYAFLNIVLVHSTETGQLTHVLRPTLACRSGVSWLLPLTTYFEYNQSLWNFAAWLVVLIFLLLYRRRFLVGIAKNVVIKDPHHGQEKRNEFDLCGNTSNLDDPIIKNFGIHQTGRQKDQRLCQITRHHEQGEVVHCKRIFCQSEPRLQHDKIRRHDDTKVQHIDDEINESALFPNGSIPCG